MTFTPKSFTPLDTLPALDLNEMDGNDDHVREEANYYHLGNFTLIDYEATTGSIAVRLYIDTTAVGVAHSTSGDKSEPDISLSAFADGIHTLTFKRGGTDLGPKIRFCKTPDMDMLTYWVTIGAAVGASNPFGHSLSHFTAIGHREAKSWT